MLTEMFQSILAFCLKMLPDSPFRGFIDKLGGIPYLSALNYFVPVSDFVALLSLWVAAIGLYYVVSTCLRMIHAID